MPFLSPFSRVICPHCSEQFHLSQAPHRLVNSSAAKERDKALEQHFGIAMPPQNPIDESMVSRSLASRLLRCGFVSRAGQDARKICPHCHIILPSHMATGEVSSEVIAIVGSRNAGKSNYFGVLLHALRKRYSAEIGFDMLDVTTFTAGGPISTHDLYQYRYGRHLFGGNNRQAVPQTTRASIVAGSNDDPRIPLIYLLRFPKRRWQKVTRPLDDTVPVYLMIYDAAGEDLQDEGVVEIYYRFFARATGMIFLIDPFEYEEVRASLPLTLQQRLPSVGADPSLVVDRVLRGAEEQDGTRAASRLSIPAAFVLTKADVFRNTPDLVDPQSFIFREANHKGGYDRAGGESLSEELAEYLRTWRDGGIANKARQRFQHHAFFAVSALGSMPEAGSLKLTGPPAPWRIADPLLWLLWRRGYIDEKRRA